MDPAFARFHDDDLTSKPEVTSLTGFVFSDYGHVTMSITRKSIAAGDFKARCLKLLDEVAETGQEITVTKRGKAVARLVPLAPKVARSLVGSVLKQGDLVAPIGDTWDAGR
jgi:prevent-host-death family protein